MIAQPFQLDGFLLKQGYGFLHRLRGLDHLGLKQFDHTGRTRRNAFIHCLKGTAKISLPDGFDRPVPTF
jgi:hypothetical protein